VRGRRSINPAGIKHILVRGVNWVGDAVMTLPALEALKEAFAWSEVTVMAKPWVAPIYAYHPVVDQILAYEKEEEGLKGLTQTVRSIRRIRENPFDLAVLFQNAFEAALLAFLGGVPLRVGYNTDGRGLLLTHRVVRGKDLLKIHQTEYYLSLVRGLGIEAENRIPNLHVSQADRHAAEAVLLKHGIHDGDFLLGVGPGAVFGGAKRWPAERFARIGDMAGREWGARTLIFGSGKEAAICGRVREEMQGPALDLGGRTSLGVAMALIEQCAFFVANDSGLMHIAAALGVPTVAIFGPTDPVATGPRGPYTAIVQHDTACAPCLRPECTEDHACMLGIRPEEVWEAMTRLRVFVCNFSATCEEVSPWGSLPKGCKNRIQLLGTAARL